MDRRQSRATRAVTRLTGELRLSPGSWNLRQHPENLPVVALDGTGKVIAQSQLGPYDRFELQIPDGHNKVEIQVALPGVAPATVELDGSDVVAVVLYFENNLNSRF